MVDRAVVHGLDLLCPSCQQTMQVCALACGQCDLQVEGSFESNEFAELSAEHLQLLRVFVHCEGRIRDMEKVLGVSYPTVKNRIAAMRAHLGLSGDAHEPQVRDDEPVRRDGTAATPAAALATTLATTPAIAPEAAPSPNDLEVNALAVLDALERGEIDHARAVADLRAPKQRRLD